jgi:hypothetical protein
MRVLEVLEGEYAIARLHPDAVLPSWAGHAPFISVTRTVRELSIVAPAAAVPADIEAARGWRCLALEGPIPFEVTGVAASLTAPLAAAAISVFLVSTFETDYLLVRSNSFEQSLEVLKGAGFEIRL